MKKQITVGLRWSRLIEFGTKNDRPKIAFDPIGSGASGHFDKSDIFEVELDSFEGLRNCAPALYREVHATLTLEFDEDEKP